MTSYSSEGHLKIVMQQKSTRTISEIWSEAKVFLELRLEYIKLKALERISKVVADVITSTLVIVFMLIAFLAGAITLAFYFSSLFDSYTAGFGVAAIFFLLLAIVVLFTKDKFEKGIANIAIKRYFAKHHGDEEETSL
ncbi:MAG TPA: phage holin family protein [Pedobacter sp.]|jgi:sterol desaturase/sphingolipid hydroxylase (fatty acid hydroxylase superfamily)